MPRSPRIAVVDYGAGNLKSVAKALVRSGLVPQLTVEPGDVRSADNQTAPAADLPIFAPFAVDSSGKVRP